ncbi:helix-turn-helix transcriptional regulator [Thermogemmatispora carboxidivorans]|uniref:helix-turn-helix transcriptional regulator n=1 Tax=Thermogemmatispora carboxidivorans TaxID=1382306 RepID=UPI00069B2AE0|nr:helix-turn-helix transcriptional regulator [Thermogemmatispora carboxidivorans]
MSGVHWWRRYGEYAPGKHNLPHMGAVLSDYRQRRGYSRAEVAQALRVKKQTVSYWEATMYLADPERRVLLARFLQIPPALLGLAWEQVAYVGKEGEPGASYERLAEVVSLEGYYQYEDLLTLANRLQYTGQIRILAERMPRWLGRLRQKVKEAPASEREAWLWLQGQYLHLTAWLASHQPGAAQRWKALGLTQELLGLARELDDPTLTGLAFFHLAHRHLEVGDRTSAGAAAWAGLSWVKRVGPALGGNLYLRAATVLAEVGEGDERQWRGWQEEALKLVERVEGGEEDASQLKLNRAAVHHERAKLLLTLVQRQGESERLGETYRELAQARSGLGRDVGAWQMYLDVTEAKLFLAWGEVEQSAWLGARAWDVAQQMGSVKVEPELRGLYASLSAKAPGHASVQWLGLTLGMV